MSVITVLLVLSLVGVLARSPRVRARLALLGLDALAEVRAQLGPMSTRALVRAAVRQARTKAADSPSGLVAPNRIEVLVAARDHDGFGPLADSIGAAILDALRGEAEHDEEFILLPDTTVQVLRAPGVRSHRPQFRMKLVRTESAFQRPDRAPAERDLRAEPTALFPRPVGVPIDQPTTADRTPDPRTVMTPPPFEAEVLVDNEPVLTVQLGVGRHRVGRAVDCDVKVAHPTVSAHQALLVVGREHATIQDTDSTNGTRVHGTLAERPEPLQDGDTILLSASVSLRVLRAGVQRQAA